MSGQVEEHVIERARALRDMGPGRVSVDRVNDIESVQLLRALRDRLDGAQLAAVESTRARLEEDLAGIERSSNPTPKQSPNKGLLARILSPLAGMGSKEAVERERHERMVQNAGGPASLPAPKSLLDAAEAWMIAELAAVESDGDLAALRQPWETATVTAEG